MGYTLGELHERLKNSKSVQREVDIVEVRDWAEEAEREIAKLYGQHKTYEYTDATAGEEYELPADFFIRREVRVKMGDRWASYLDYTFTPDNKIVFANNGDFRLTYQCFPAKLNDDPDQELSVHPAFHLSVIDYLLYRYWQRQSEGEQGELQYSEVYHGKFRSEILDTAMILHDQKKKMRAVRPYNVVNISEW